jgi:mono/diheme cytochrome c family protein
VDTGSVLAITFIVLVPAATLWGLFLMRQRRSQKPAAMLGIPQAMRPAPPDDVLEGPRLQRVIVGGLVATLATAAFIPIYWLPERQRQEAFEHRFAEGSLERGQLIYSAPPALQEDIPAAEFKAEEKALALGQNCANCHGPPPRDLHTPPDEDVASGGIGNPAFRDPITNEVVAYRAPPLNNVFTRWDEEVVRFTIERGRPGTDMPAWGVEYGGSMTEMMVDDVINWLKSLPANNRPPGGISDGCLEPTNTTAIQCGREIFEARCAVCHGPEGQGKEGTETMTIRVENEDVEAPIWYQGMALWKGDVRHLPRSLHEYTIRNGRRFAFMPQFAEAPAQGIPVPPYPLTDKQIEAVMEYERTL